MADIKRNQTASATVPADPIPATEKREERKPVSGSFAKPQALQVHFGNVEGLKLKLLEAISLSLQTLCDLADPDGSRRKDILERRMKEEMKADDGRPESQG